MALVAIILSSYVYVLVMFLPQRNVMFSGVIPQLSLIMGPCAGVYRKLSFKEPPHLADEREIWLYKWLNGCR